MSLVYARVVIPHSDLGEDDYHQWITRGERVRADKLGRPHPQMYDDHWTRWICNNGDCPAWALVADHAIVDMLDEAEQSHPRRVLT